MKVVFKKMSKATVVVFVCALSSLLLEAEAHKWELKVNAGAAYRSIGGFNDFMDGLKWNLTKGDEDPKHAHWGIDASAEMVYRLDKNYGVSVGTGFLQVKQKTGEGVGNNVMSHFETHIQAVPLTLNLHYTLPLGQKLRFGINAGPGLYFGRFTLKNNLNWMDGLHVIERKTHGLALGGQAAMGLEMNLGSHLALTAEINGRLVRFDKMMEKVEVWNDGQKSHQDMSLPYNLDLSGVGLRLGVMFFL